MKKINKKGFTLVEVLGVLVIIGVLALIVVPKITEYMQNGKDNYNNKLGGQLLLTGKSYFSDNKKELPTDNSSKKYGYITWDQLDSDKYTTNSLVDSEGRDCSQSYVYVKESLKNPGKYDYTSCLICEDSSGNITNHNIGNAYCNVANWSDETPPTCDPQEEYEFSQYVQIVNPNDLLSPGGAPGKIIAIEILSTADSILSSTGLEPGQTKVIQTNMVTGSGNAATTERKDITVGIVDENTVHINLEENQIESITDIAKIDLKPIIEYLFKPLDRTKDNRKGASHYYINLIDQATNMSEPSCVEFEVGNDNNMNKITSGDTCDLAIDGSTVTIKELAVDRAINDIYYYNASGQRVSIIGKNGGSQLIPANLIKLADITTINPESEEETFLDYGYDDGFGYVVPGTSFVVDESITDYIKDLHVEKVLMPQMTADENPPIDCSFKKDGATDNPPTCTGTQKGNKLSLTIKDDNGINDIHYRNKQNQIQHILEENDKGQTSLNFVKELDSNAPEEASVTVEDVSGQTKVCDLTYISEPKPGYPKCEITRTDNKSYLNKANKQATFKVTCTEPSNSVLTVSSSWRGLLIAKNGKGKVEATTIPTNGSTVTFNVTYTANDNTAGSDYFTIKEGLVTTSTGKNNSQVNSGRINIDTTLPNIVYKLGSTLKGTLSGETGVYFTPFSLTVTCKDSSYPGASEATLYMDVKNAGTASQTAAWSKITTQPKTYTVSSFGSSETAYKKGDSTATNVYLRKYLSKCTDAAGNTNSKTESYKVGKAPKSNCKFTQSISGWQKRGVEPKFTVTCTVPAGNTTMHISDTKNDNGKYTKIGTTNKLGYVKNCSVSGNNTKTLKITCTYHVYADKTGNDKITIGAGIIETAQGASNTAVNSANIKVDSILPVVNYTKDSNSKGSPHHASWSFKVKCSDQGSGVKNIKLNSSTYSTTEKEITISSIANPKKYSAYCTDKAGNQSTTKNRTYYVQVKGAHKSCGVKSYKSCRNKNCSCAKWNSCKACGCKYWKYKNSCQGKWYSCGSYSGWSAPSSRYSCSQKSHSGNKKYSGCTVQYYSGKVSCTSCKKCSVTCSKIKDYCSTYKACSSCSCNTRNSCADSSCGVKSYKTCWHY